MVDFSQDSIELLSQLALEYQQKQKELDAILENADPEKILQQLSFRAELTTDHFRGAQRALLGLLPPGDDGEKSQARQAAVALFRCFDEMRILFQAVAALPSKTES